MLLLIIIIYVLLIMGLHIVPIGSSGIALSSTEVASFRTDYLLHTAVFFPWMILVWLYLNEKNVFDRVRFKYAIRWFCAGLFVAVFAEGVQYYLPYRAFNIMDVYFNLLGVMLGSVVFLWKRTPENQDPNSYFMKRSIGVSNYRGRNR